MEPCSRCARHLRTTETVCPFCGAEQRAERAPLGEGVLALVATFVLGMSACSSPAESGPEAVTTTDPSSTTSTTSTTSADESESGTSETSTITDDGSSVTTEEPSATGVFYGGAEVDFGGVSECDPFMQDCPEGEKCVPYGSTGGNWDANKCVMIDGEGVAGEPCRYGGVVESTDDCDADHFCWNAQYGEEPLPVGECVAFCGGTADDPVCAPGSSCLVANDGSLSLCLPSCDPLLQDCGEGEMCGLNDDEGEFVCLVSAGNLPTEEPCGFANDCSPSHLCLSAEALLACNGSACCAELCSVDEPSCATPGLECAALFPGGGEPPEPSLEGICAAPDACPEGCADQVVGSTVAAVLPDP